MKKLRAAVVGVGYLGRFHAQKYLANPQVELVGVCDFSIEQAQKVSEELKVPAFKNAQDLLGQVDLVTVAASTQSHYELTKLFLENKIPVNVEKPIAATLAQAEELVALAEKNKTLLAVGQIERFNPAVTYYKSLQSTPLSISLERQATFKTRGADVSVLHDLLIHDIDMAHDLTGSKVKSMMATGAQLVSNELDSCQCVLEMQNGIQVYIDVSRVALNQKRSMRVTEKNRVLYFNTGTLELEIAEKNPENPLEVKKTQLTIEKKDALQEETNAFVSAVLGEAPLRVTGSDGLEALRVVEKMLSFLKK